jgi:hypothetical protein
MAPWDGYYILQNFIKHAIANAYGVWYEIKKQGNTWTAIQVAQPSFKVNHWPMNRINMEALKNSGVSMPLPL